MNSSQSNREDKGNSFGGSALGQKACPPWRTVKEPLRAPCLWRKCKEGLPNSLDKDAVPCPSVCILGNQSLLFPFVMRKSSRSSRMQCPELALLSVSPIVMVINLLALSSEPSEVAFEELGSHYHATTVGQQTKSIQQGNAREVDGKQL